ncbi:MAG: PAS domain S-box protein [Desulfarculaceae bacterium]|nr:PAS domain S-box protein [Desulfarculaceae bacterium]
MFVDWGIRKKLTVITVATIIPLLAGAIWVTMILVDKSYSRQAAYLERANLERVANRLSFLTDNAVSDTLFLADLSFVRELSQAAMQRSTGQEPKARFHSEYRESLETMLEFVSSKKVYDQARLLDAAGREILRVNLVDGKAQAVPASQLQSKANRYYFTNAAKLPPGRVYVSYVDLNREGGKIEKPLKPMLRFAAAVRDAQGNLTGVVVLNFYVSYLFQRSLKDVLNTTQGKWVILDQDGYYLFHSKYPSREWGSPRDLNTGERCQKYFGKACQTILDGKDTEVNTEGGNWLSYSQVVRYPGNLDRFMVVAHFTPPPAVVDYLGRFGWVLGMILVVTLAAILLLVWISGRMVVLPMISLSNTMGRLRHNDLSARSSLSGKDELGRLAQGFNQMAESLQEAYGEMERQVRATEEANRELSNSEARVKAILDSTVDAIITITSDGVVQSFNQGAEKLFGYSALEVVGNKVNMLQPQDVAAQHDEYLQRYLETGEPHIIGVGREERGRRKDGTLFPMYLAVSEAWVEGDRLFTGIIRDTTKLKQTEESLRKSQRMYQSLADASPVGIFNTDQDGLCDYVNEQWLEMAGITAEEAMGDGWARAIHPEDRDAIYRDWQRTAEWGNPFEGEYRFQHADGKVVWFYVRAVPQAGEDGSANSFVGVVMDITERKETEKARAESMQLFQSTFEQAAVGIAHVAPDGKWLRVNSKLCQIVGYNREELLESAFQKITHPDDLDKDLSLVNKVLAGEIDTYTLEKRYLKKDGAVVWINLTVALVRDENGEPDYFISVVEDIDLRKKAESARAESEKRFRTLVANVPGAVYRCEHDENWTMRYISEPIRTITGYPPSDFIDNFQRAYVDIIHPDDREMVSKRISESVERGRGFEVEYRIIRRDGQVRWVYERGAAIADDQGTQWLDGAILDVTERKMAEQDNLRLGRILEESQNEIFIFDAESLKFLQVNQGARRNLGYSMEELRGMTPVDIKPEFTQEEFQKLVEPLHKGLESHLIFNTVHQRKNGSTYEVEVNLQLSTQELAPVFVAVIQDMTEKNRSQAEIQRLSLVAERTDNVVIITDGEGYIQWANQAFFRVSGYTLPEVEGKKPGVLLQGPDTDPDTVRFMSRQLARGEGFNVEIVNYSKNGHKYWQAVDVQPVHDDKGKLTNFVAVQQDITERKRNEVELRQQAQIIDQTHDAVISVSLEGEVTSWNQGAQALFGYNKEEALGKRMSFILRSQDAASLDETVLEELYRKGQHELEIVLKKKSGMEFTALLSLSLLKNLQGMPDGFVAYAVDISERKKAEEAVRMAKETAEEASRIKSEFLANMSHELRTPLNAIIGFSEILVDQTFGELNEKQLRQTRHILESGRHLLSLINDILDLSKVESGKMELEPSAVNLGGVLEATTVLIKEKAAKHGITLSLELPEELRLLNFTADERKLKQIMFNLLSNAAKFTPDGGAITITAAKEVGFIQVSVQDTGLGISPEDQARIFDEFEQVDSTYARKQQGTGLGLALTRKLVELHGGRIWLESEGLNQGSTFTFTIPLDLSARVFKDEAEPEPTNGSEADEDQELEGGTVLVVDDDPMARELLAGYLREGGYKTVLAADGAKGMEMALKHKPMAITLDLMLPDTSGFEVLRQLQEDPETASIPVIIVSITDDREKGLSLGAVEFLQKPVNKDQLLQILSDFVSCSAEGFSKVLVVDDNPADVELVHGILGTRGCEIIEARGGEEGIEIALREKPDLIVLDLNMPGTSGWDVLETLHEKSGNWRPPILVFTGAYLTSQERQKLAGQVQAVVMKGGGKQDLLREISRLTQMTFDGSAKE